MGRVKKQKISAELESLRQQAERLAIARGHSWSWVLKADEERLRDYLENPIYPAWWEMGFGRREKI